MGSKPTPTTSHFSGAVPSNRVQNGFIRLCEVKLHSFSFIHGHSRTNCKNLECNHVKKRFVNPVINLPNYCVHNIQIYPKQNLKLPCCNFPNVFTVFNGVNVSVGGSQIRETEKTFLFLGSDWWARRRKSQLPQVWSLTHISCFYLNSWSKVGFIDLIQHYRKLHYCKFFRSFQQPKQCPNCFVQNVHTP